MPPAAKWSNGPSLQLLESGRFSAQGLQIKASGVESPCPLAEVVSGKSALGVLLIVSKSEVVFVRPSVHPLAARTHPTQLRVDAHSESRLCRTLMRHACLLAAFCLALLCVCPLLSQANAATTGGSHNNNWAVIVNTSRYWFNYRHVANALSIYTTVKRYTATLR